MDYTALHKLTHLKWCMCQLYTNETKK